MAALPTLFSREIRSRWRLLKTSWILWVHILTSGPDTSGRPHRQFIACILKEVPNIFNRFNRWSRKSSRPWRVLSEPSAAISVIWAFPLSPVDLARAESCSVQLQNSDSDWSDLPGCPQGLKVERFSRPWTEAWVNWSLSSRNQLSPCYPKPWTTPNLLCYAFDRRIGPTASHNGTSPL